MPGEILVIANEEALEQVKALFETTYTSKDSLLVLAEKAESGTIENDFSFWYARHKAYESNEKLSPLVVVYETAGSCGDFSADLDKAGVKPTRKGTLPLEVYTDVWAKPQTVVRVKGELNPGLVKALSDIFHTAEKKQGLTGNLAPNPYCDSVSRVIQGNYGFGLKFPPQMSLQFSNREVVWLWQQTNQFYRHVFINIFSDSLKLETREQAVANRNLFTIKYVTNDEKTKTVVSENSLFPLRWSGFDAKGVAVLRGWYTEEGTYRRGPFVRYIYHDKPNNRYVAVDGFVFAPDQSRLSYVRTLELIAESLQFSR
ncbi:MAG: DUF4837 family protein [Bacteroidetes bacterium]|nr:DUF4837 family protein [Bacteroidota bacterium]